MVIENQRVRTNFKLVLDDCQYLISEAEMNVATLVNGSGVKPYWVSKFWIAIVISMAFSIFLLGFHYGRTWISAPVYHITCKSALKSCTGKKWLDFVFQQNA